MIYTYEFKRKYEREKNNYQNEVNIQANFICAISDYLDELIILLFTSGLDSTYIKEIEDEISKLYQIDFDIRMSIENHIKEYDREKRFTDLIKYQKFLLRIIGDIGIRLLDILESLRLGTSQYDLTRFIKANSSLLHLVSTNNHSNQHIRKVSDDAYLYLCQFHIEHTPSMIIRNNKNKLHCYGCGLELNIFEYLSEIEEISYDDAKMLLAEINKIKINENPFKSSDAIVKKYTCAASLRRYKSRVLEGQKRAMRKNKTLNNILALKKFEQELATIKRIECSEYIEFTQPKKPSKILKYIK